MIIKTISRALIRVKSSRLYYRIFLAQIDARRVEDLKAETILKYPHIKGWV